MNRNMVVLASSGGSVLDAAFRIDGCRKHISLIICDRHCGAVEVGRRHGIPVKVVPCCSGWEFSDALYNYFLEEPKVDLFISSYSRMLSGKFLEKYRGKIINFHPAILPAFPGLDGFGDTLKAGSKLIGSSVHFVDEGMDTGRPIMQAARPYDPGISEEENRHFVFQQMVRMFVQITLWFAEGRVGPDGEIYGASYRPSEYAPNIEFQFHDQ